MLFSKTKIDLITKWLRSEVNYFIKYGHFSENHKLINGQRDY